MARLKSIACRTEKYSLLYTVSSTGILKVVEELLLKVRISLNLWYLNN